MLIRLQMYGFILKEYFIALSYILQSSLIKHCFNIEEGFLNSCENHSSASFDHTECLFS